MWPWEIRAGQSTLFAFEAQGTRYIMVGILIASNVPQSGSQENRQWKHVAPHQTELAILPRAMAATFCLNALTAHPDYLYVQDWHRIFSPTEGDRVQMTMHHIELLGETRSADDLGVFCTMPPERLTIGCGLYNPERPESSHSNQKGLLRSDKTRAPSLHPGRMIKMMRSLPIQASHYHQVQGWFHNHQSCYKRSSCSDLQPRTPQTHKGRCVP